jgi:hypothetical protein
MGERPSGDDPLEGRPLHRPIDPFEQLRPIDLRTPPGADDAPLPGPTRATPGPAAMRETLASARRRLVHEDVNDDLPRSAAELRAALRDATTIPAGKPPPVGRHPATRAVDDRIDETATAPDQPTSDGA